jgi:hypothetical protein
MRKVKFFSVLVLLALLLGINDVVVTAHEPPPTNVDQTLPNDIEAVLFNYSEALSTGQLTQEAYYTPTMQDLLRERRRFYEEYFEVLHSTLESISSKFVFDPNSVGTDTEVPVSSDGRLMLGDASISVLSDGRLSVQVTEKVILRGRYNTPPEEHPLVLAGHWALSRTDDEHVKRELEKYIESVMEGTRKSFEEGFETPLIVRHSLVVARTPAGLQIVEDSFTDQDAVFSGVDHIIWVDGQYVRTKPDFTAMPDYQRYAMPIEELGKKLLDRFTEDHSR